MANQKITISVDFTSNTSQIENGINKVAQKLNNLKVNDKTGAGLKAISESSKEIVEQLKNASKGDFTVGGIENTLKQSANLKKELVDMKKELSTLHERNSIDILPENTQSNIKNLRKEITQYKKDVESISQLQERLRNYNANLGDQKFDIKKSGLTRDFNKILGPDFVRYIKDTDNNFEHLNQTLNGMKADGLEKVRKSISDITKTPLEKVSTDVEGLSRNVTTFQNIQIGRAKTQFTNLTKDINTTITSVEKLEEASKIKLFEGQELERRSREIQMLSRSLESFFGIQNMINLFKRGVREAIQVVQELDAAMAATAVVTDFSINDMWAQLPTYQKMADNLGVTIKDVYEASTLYYQQGLDTNQVMEVTNQTLQMARIAGIGAAEATDMMTAALRGFNMEVNEDSAQKVNDIFSKLAAITASDTKELGTALEKTASIANSAGMSIEVTTALLAQAIEATREAPENIGTAMKTIIARFQELKKNPLTISEIDGETVDFNKVDTALKTIGIDLVQDTDNFRNLDKVLLEISSRWNGLTQTQRRYIATIVAGSRQQSRFIAMMGDNARLTELVGAAYNSSGAAAEQYAKTQESLETAFNRLKNAWHTFLMGIANNKLIKVAVEGLTKLLEFVNKIFDTIGKLPGGIGDVTKAIAQLAATIGALKGARVVLGSLIGGFTNMWVGKGNGLGSSKNFLAGIIRGFKGPSKGAKASNGIKNIYDSWTKDSALIPKEVQEKLAKGVTEEIVEESPLLINGKKHTTTKTITREYTPEESETILRNAAEKEYNKQAAKPSPFWNFMVKGANGPLDALNKIGSSIKTNFGKGGNLLTKIGKGFKGFWEALGGGGKIAVIIAGVAAAIAIVRKFIRTTQERIDAKNDVFKQYQDKVNEIAKSQTKVSEIGDEFNQLAEGVDEQGRNISLSAEEYARYNELVDELVDINPSLVKGYTAEGNAIINKNNAIRETNSLLERNLDLERAELYSTKNLKTIAEGYAAENKKIQDERQELANEMAGGQVIASEGTVVTYMMQTAEGSVISTRDVGIDLTADIEDLDLENASKTQGKYAKQLAALRKKELTQYNEQTKTWLDYGDFLGFNEEVDPDLQQAYNAYITSLVRNGKITDEKSAYEGLVKAVDFTDTLKTLTDEETGESYADILRKYEQLQKEWSESNKTEEDIKRFNAESTKYIETLERISDNATNLDDTQKKVFKQAAENMKDYKTSVVSVAEAFNPLTKAISKANNAVKEFKTLTEGNDFYTAAEGMTEILDTILDTTEDEAGKNQSGRGSQTYWTGAKMLLGEDVVRELGSKQAVDRQLMAIQPALEIGEEGYKEFQKLLNWYLPSLTQKGGLFEGATDFADVINHLTSDNLPKLARYMGMSEEALTAMVNNARQFGNFDFTNVSLLQEALQNEASSGEGRSIIGYDKNGKRRAILTSDADLKASYQQSTGDYSEQGYQAQRTKIAQEGQIYTIDFSEETRNWEDIKKQLSSYYQQSDLTQLDETQFANDMAKLGGTEQEILDLWENTIGQQYSSEEERNAAMEEFRTNELAQALKEPAVDSIDKTTNQILGVLTKLAAKQGLDVSNELMDQLDANQNAFFEDARSGKFENSQIEADSKKINKAYDDLAKSLGHKDMADLWQKAQDGLVELDGESARLVEDYKAWIDELEKLFNEKGINKDKLPELKEKEPIKVGEITSGTENTVTSDVMLQGNQKESTITYTAVVDDEDARETMHQLSIDYDNQSFYTTVDADTSAATAAINAYYVNSITGIVEKGYITGIGADTTQAGAAIQKLINGIPTSINIKVGMQAVIDEAFSKIFGIVTGKKIGSGTVGTTVSSGGVSTGGNKIANPGGYYPGSGSRSGGSGGGGGGGGGGGSSKSDTEPYGKDISKIQAELNRIVSYERLQEIHQARFEKLTKQGYLKQPGIAEVTKSWNEIRTTTKSIINIQKGILDNGKSTYNVIIGELNKALKEAGGKGSITDYISVNYDRKLINVTTKGLQSTGEIKNVVSNAYSVLDHWFGELFEAEKGIEENTAKLYDLYNESRDDAANLYEGIEKGLIQFRQDAIDRLSQVNDTISDSNQKILDKTKESIDLQRQNRENDKKRQDLEDKRTRLSLLMQDTQGGHQVEIANLQKELAEGTQDFQDTLVDQKLEELTKANEDAKEQRERQITLLQRQLDWAQDTGAIWDEIRTLVSDAFYGDMSRRGTWQEERAAGQFLRYGQDYNKQNRYRQDTIKYGDDQTAARALPGFRAGGEFGAVKEGGGLLDRMLLGKEAGGIDPNSKINLVIDGETKTGTTRLSSDKKSAWIDYTDTKTGEKLRLYDKDVKQIGDTYDYTVIGDRDELVRQGRAGDLFTVTYSNSHGTFQAPAQWTTSGDAVTRGINIGWTGKRYWIPGEELVKNSDGSWGIDSKFIKTQSQAAPQVLLNSTWRRVKVGGKWYFIDENGYYTNDDGKKIKAYKTGGLADFTGPAWLDGTPSKPEMVLNQTDTQNFIQLKDILASIMKYNGLKSDSISSTSSGDTNFEININVDHLNSDYDVDKVAARVTKLITKSAAYRNPVKVTNYR